MAPAIAVMAAVVAAGKLATASTPVSLEGEFDSFSSSFSKTYSTQYEKDLRLAIFKANYRYVQEHNANGLSYTLAVNEFADMTPEEFHASRLGLDAPPNLWGGLLGTKLNTSGLAEAPSSVDWTAVRGRVNAPKNQGHCGSCWAFSTVSTLESAWAIAGGPLLSLSEQQFLDCDTVDHACKGGSPAYAYKFMEQTGICSESSYPYDAAKETCHTSSCKVGIPKGAITGYHSVAQDNEMALMQAVAQQPTFVAIQANQLPFQLYSSGVMSGDCGFQLDHGVVAVGYGTDAGQQYWKIRNSWGAAWGESGYIRLQRGMGGHGQCGILLMAAYPVVSFTKSSDTIVPAAVLI